ncbi:hypothetical protein F4692_004125 [Nocardioides cavernae]|uniref:Uncharacterized protein n=1 Tax=Nocardioides cavernae TaxID=1921566 RepID=A0A7Y9H6T1_9ACTN|nr:hypothetical protein [Nocardioides cavernae]NYE38970.1 hypothetical protein [Nocardioides cavernae]
MTDDRTPLQTTIDAFSEARGEEFDETWAWSVSMALLMRSVEADLVREGLAEALTVVRESQESPEALFGPAREHAAELYDRWVDEARLRLDDTHSMTWRDVPSWGLGFAAVMCVVFAVLFAMRGDSLRPWTWGMVLIPVVIGVGPVAAAAAWDDLLRRHSTASAVGAAAAAVAVLSTGAAIVNEWSKDHPLGTHSVWWYVPVAATCALLATAWGRWTRTWPSPTPRAAVSADDWSRELAGLLRERYSLSDVRVRTIVAEAHAHAAETGRSLREEFGTPSEYAARFAPDLARRSLLKTWFYLVMAVLNVVGLLVSDRAWSSLLLAAGFAWFAWREYLRYLEQRRGPATA